VLIKDDGTVAANPGSADAFDVCDPSITLEASRELIRKNRKLLKELAK